MKTQRKQLAIVALVASMGVLAACSKEEEAPAPVAAPAVEQPAPTSAAPVTEPTPVAPTPAPESTTGSTQSTQDAIVEKAAEVRDEAAAAANKVGDAIKQGAADQNAIGNGQQAPATEPATTPTQPTPATN